MQGKRFLEEKLFLLTHQKTFSLMSFKKKKDWLKHSSLQEATLKGTLEEYLSYRLEQEDLEEIDEQSNIRKIVYEIQDYHFCLAGNFSYKDIEISYDMPNKEQLPNSSFLLWIVTDDLEECFKKLMSLAQGVESSYHCAVLGNWGVPFFFTNHYGSNVYLECLNLLPKELFKRVIESLFLLSDSKETSESWWEDCYQDVYESLQQEIIARPEVLKMVIQDALTNGEAYERPSLPHILTLIRTSDSSIILHFHDDSRLMDILSFLGEIDEFSSLLSSIELELSNQDYEELPLFLPYQEKYEIKILYSEEQRGDVRDAATVEEFLKMRKELRYFEQLLREFDSPLEKILVAYELCRQYPYQEDHDNEWNSRFLHKIFYTHHIVCIGYAKILNHVLRQEKIPNEVMGIWKKQGDDVGHAFNFVRVDDSKYQVYGEYALDVTADALDSEEQNWEEAFAFFHGFMIPQQELVSHFSNYDEELMQREQQRIEKILFAREEEYKKYRDETKKLSWETFLTVYENVHKKLGESTEEIERKMRGILSWNTDTQPSSSQESPKIKRVKS